MGSYAYLTAGIITARQAKLMKNAFWPMLRQGLLYTIPLTLVSFAIGVIIAVLCALFIINKIIYQVGAATIYTYIIYLNIIGHLDIFFNNNKSNKNDCNYKKYFFSHFTLFQ